MGKLNWRKRVYALFLLCATTAIALPAQTFTTLHSFDSTDGFSPNALVQATNGNLYGTTYFGGTNGGCDYGCGTVFEITPSGTLTTLHSFNGTDGSNPSAGLVQATDGNFYGTTFSGGANGDYGTIFKITPSGTLTTLHGFDGTDGNSPVWLVQATNGNLYGTTIYGGANGFYGGAIFKITLSGTLTTLDSFCQQSGCTDGEVPLALAQAADGNFYGTTGGGGVNGLGTVFKITPSGTLTTLHSFDNTDGAGPSAGLVQAANGNFHGTTISGGANAVGTVFKITPNGTLTTLYSFCSESNCTDGGSPVGPLVLATDGNFYGTTYHSGANGDYGTIFKITPSGTLTTVHSFDGADGKNPWAALVQATNGSFYGPTELGGANYGTVFSLSVGLGPFVEALPTSGKVGVGVKILGTNLTGATSVTFNGVAAVFHVLSSSFITANVPVGATSGKVQVVTPGGTLSSNVSFRVLP